MLVLVQTKHHKEANAGTNGADTTFGISGTAYLTALGGGGGASGLLMEQMEHIQHTDGGSGGGGAYHSQGGNNGTAGTGSQPNTWSGPSGGSAGATITGYGNPGGSVPSPSNMGGGGGASEVLVVFLATQIIPIHRQIQWVLGNHFQLFQVQFSINSWHLWCRWRSNGSSCEWRCWAANTGQGGQGGWNFGSGRGGAGGSGVAFLIVPNTNAPLITTPAPSSLLEIPVQGQYLNLRLPVQLP